MSWPLLASFLLAALVMQLVPGPGMLFILAQAIGGGRRAGIVAALGAAAGMLVHTVAASLGLAELFRHAPTAYAVLRIVGAVYLLWMAVGHWRADGLATRATARGEGRGARVAPRRVFVRAWLNNLSNPKVILFYLAFLPQFVDPHGAPVTVQLIVLGTAFLVIGLASDLVLATFAGRIGEWLATRARLRRGIDWLAGTILGALGVRLLVSGPSA